MINCPATRSSFSPMSYAVSGCGKDHPQSHWAAAQYPNPLGPLPDAAKRVTSRPVYEPRGGFWSLKDAIRTRYCVFVPIGQPDLLKLTKAITYLVADGEQLGNS